MNSLLLSESMLSKGKGAFWRIRWIALQTASSERRGSPVNSAQPVHASVQAKCSKTASAVCNQVNFHKARLFFVSICKGMDCKFLFWAASLVWWYSSCATTWFGQDANGDLCWQNWFSRLPWRAVPGKTVAEVWNRCVYISPEFARAPARLRHDRWFVVAFVFPNKETHITTQIWLCLLRITRSIQIWSIGE